METMSSVVKSKSSNSAQSNRCKHQNKNKKSRSNAEFQQQGPGPGGLKKRGVYVEKKRSKMTIDEPGKNHVQEKPIKAPPRPKPGNKKFLASVLTILSKSTTGTQFPDVKDAVTKKKARKRVINYSPTRMDDKDLNKVGDQTKKKYRSKALNDEVNKDFKQEQVVILQSKKEMVQTPSMYSENDSFKQCIVPLAIEDNENIEMIDNNEKAVANELVKQIMEGQNARTVKRVRIDTDEPTTLVSKYAKTKPADNDKGLYNIFFDLLEKTISVYNVKTEYDTTYFSASEGSSTKIPMEIEESVAKKLNTNMNTQQTVEAKPSSHFFCLQDQEFGQQDNFSPYIDAPSKPRKKKLQAESFFLPRNPPTRKIKTKSLFDTKSSRKEKKKRLINFFEEQLKMDDNEYEEPQNMYEALKVMAQNKRRCQKQTHFEDLSRRKHDDMGFPDCMYRGRKVISLRTKSTKHATKKPVYDPPIDRKYSELSSATNIEESASDIDQSRHSLEVYGVDYEREMKPLYNRPKMWLGYHSASDSSSHASEGEIEDLDFTDSMFFNGLLDDIRRR